MIPVLAAADRRLPSSRIGVAAFGEASSRVAEQRVPRREVTRRLLHDRCLPLRWSAMGLGACDRVKLRKLRILLRDLLRRGIWHCTGLKIRMLKDLPCRHALVWVPFQHVFHDVDPVLIGLGYQRLEPGRHKLREAEANRGRELVTVRPLALARRSEHGANLEELVGLGSTRKERPQRVEFCHDAAACPQVQRRIVNGAPQQNLWRSVPAGGNVIGEGWPCADLSREPEVCEFHRIPAIQQVFRLHVTMEIATFVYMVKSLDCLEHDVADLAFRERLHASLHQLVEVALHVLENHV
mmetsp:Transcript_24487/g.68093  ORF Transcript_24487/g.68093 Transcript_24487/m.68093 type:complete len:296 (-) Transcript_24487:381-1268(-)